MKKIFFLAIAFLLLGFHVNAQVASSDQSSTPVAQTASTDTNTATTDGGGGGSAPAAKVNVPSIDDLKNTAAAAVNQNSDATSSDQPQASQQQNNTSIPATAQTQSQPQSQSFAKSPSNVALWLVSVFSLVLNIIVIGLLIKVLRRK